MVFHFNYDLKYHYYYKEYNDQIQGALGQSGVYRLKQGDMVSVEVKNTNKTISQVLKNFMYKVTGKGNACLLYTSYYNFDCNNCSCSCSNL